MTTMKLPVLVTIDVLFWFSFCLSKIKFPFCGKATSVSFFHGVLFLCETMDFEIVFNFINPYPILLPPDTPPLTLNPNPNPHSHPHTNPNPHPNPITLTLTPTLILTLILTLTPTLTPTITLTPTLFFYSKYASGVLMWGERHLKIFRYRELQKLRGATSKFSGTRNLNFFNSISHVPLFFQCHYRF